jgi:DNA processing protein
MSYYLVHERETGMSKILTGDEIPSRVFDDPNAPTKLWLLGSLPAGKSVAIIGSRRASLYALVTASDLAERLAVAGVTVLSGGAVGVDAAAHRGALDGGGSTVVVHPGGWDRPYPRHHEHLYREIIKAGGGLVTRDPPGTLKSTKLLLARNALLVSLADVVVAVEAEVRSGTRNACSHARRIGRPLFASGDSPGGRAELALGAQEFTTPEAFVRMITKD